MCIHTLSLDCPPPFVQPPLPGAPCDESLACLSAISQTGWLAELYQGGTLLKLRAGLSGKERPPHPGAYHEWPEDAELAGEWLGYAIEHNHFHDDVHVWRPFLRGAVAGFSQQSRMRILCRINSIAPAELESWGKFVTLTYPRDLLPSWGWAKRQLNAFLQWLRKRFGRFPVIWRMEYQEDGSIHFHLMCFVRRFLPWWLVAAEWDGLIGNQVTPAESASTEVRAMKRWRGTCYYISKYIAKDSDEAALDVFNGRHWGVRFWALLPVHKMIVALSSAEGFAVRRWVARWRRAKGVKTRPLGAALPFCHCSEAGITMFAPERDTLRMLACLRGPGLLYLPNGPPGTSRRVDAV